MAEVTTLITEFFSISSKTVTELENSVKRAFASKNLQDSTDNSLISNVIITMEQVSRHDDPNDCWIIVYDKVYDVTTFLDEVRIFFMNIIYLC